MMTYNMTGAEANANPLKYDLPADWNDETYLKLNPDVKTAVAANMYQSGGAHYGVYGKKEGRKYKYTETELAAQKATADKLVAEKAEIKKKESKIFGLPKNIIYIGAVIIGVLILIRLIKK